MQHVVAEQADRVFELLEQDAVIYVCGDAAHMAPAVRATFARLYGERTGLDDEASAEAWVADLERSERYLVDVWSSR